MNNEFFEPNKPYSLADIQAVIGDRMTARQFVDRLQPRKVFKGLWLGKHILEAWDVAAGVEEVEEPTRRGRPRKAKPELIESLTD